MRFFTGYIGTHADSKFGPAGLWQGDYQGMGWRDGEAEREPMSQAGCSKEWNAAADTFSDDGIDRLQRQARDTHKEDTQKTAARLRR